MENNIKENILDTLIEITNLLDLCNIRDVSDLFRKDIDIIRDVDFNSDEGVTKLKNLKSKMVGMGSFTDIPLYPPESSSFSREDLEKKQLDLANKILELANKAIGR
ncbi:MAG: hypothetical protein OEW89_03425 [Gammaproteobacteria bacterium]|nr:hypothetical protein [Gammaproteobacteria bacterium]MDH5594525.1 hypothetical protein [Gammaproteobacteria bacterium]